MELLFERETGWLRQVRIGEREMVRAIYGAVRDRDWTTVPPVLKALSIQRPNSESFQIRLAVECRQDEISYDWQGLIAGDANGEIRFEFEGKAQGDFLRNRIGLCVLFPIAECAGKPCVVEHSDGTLERSEFPKFISPFQPFQDIRVIRQRVIEGATLEVHFAGEIFEMEDQRNWTDASFKIYGTPLARQFPVPVKKGETVRQVVTLKLIQEGVAEPKKSVSCESCLVTRDIATIDVNFEHLRAKPLLGLGLADHCEPLNSTAVSRLRALQLDHLRVDCRLWEQDWPKRLEKAVEQAEALGAGLHVALHLMRNDEAELRRIGRIIAALRAPVRLWLVFDRTGNSTSPACVNLARDILVPFGPDARFAAGTDNYFAELNRQRPPVDADWLACCSINPQVHASDDLSLIENLAAQTDVVSSARAFSAQPLVISPITLLPRRNPNSTEAVLSRHASPADPRQPSLFAAGWTLGSLAALSAMHSVFSLTYYETIGPRGVVATGAPASVFPMYHVFVGFAALTGLAEVRFADARASLQLTALAGVTMAGHSVFWLANLTAESVSVRVKTNPRFRSALIKQLDEGRLAEALHQPEKWSDNAGAFLALDSAPIINLPRYGLAQLELEP